MKTRKLKFILTFAIACVLISCKQNNRVQAQEDSHRSFELTETEIKKIDSLKYVGWTNDFEHLLLEEEVDSLNALIANFEKETTAEICILTIDSSYFEKAHFDSAIVYIARYWGVGKKQTNNGIMIGVSKSYRKIRICTGFGNEAKLTNDEAKSIIENTITPEFSRQAYYEGLKKGLLAVMAEIRKK